MAKKRKNIVLGVTGSIAAYKAGDIIRRLQENDFEVIVIMTRHAKKFITPLTLASLSGKKVYEDMFDCSAWEIEHIHLAQKADAFLIAPATANIIGKISCGLADDLLTCSVMAAKCPVLIAPAMNTAMYQNNFVQENCQRLKKQGYVFINPVKGKLACQTIGEGRLASIETIIKSVKKVVA